MRSAQFTAALLLCCLVSHCCARTPVSRDEHHQILSAARQSPREHFGAWLERHGKDYKHDALEVAKRFGIWLKNLEFILEYNAKTTTHWLGLNALADLTKVSSYAGDGHER